MQLKLKRPIIFFDLETTGLNITNDHIVELSIIKVFPDGHEEEKTRRINPGMPIPAEATAVHHITDDDVKDCPKFKQIAKSLAQMFEGCDIAGFNSNRFDIPMLAQEFSNAGVDVDFSKMRFVDVQSIYHKKEPRNLIAAYKFYCGKDLTEAHSANADTRATLEVLKAQLDYYDDLENDIEKLSEMSFSGKNIDLAGRIVKNEKGEAVFNFGQYRGKTVESVLKSTPQYLDWIEKSDFPANTKDVVRRIYMELRKRESGSGIQLKL